MPFAEPVFIYDTVIVRGWTLSSIIVEYDQTGSGAVGAGHRRKPAFVVVRQGIAVEMWKRQRRDSRLSMMIRRRNYSFYRKKSGSGKVRTGPGIGIRDISS
jgi:hypothetical protein